LFDAWLGRITVNSCRMHNNVSSPVDELRLVDGWLDWGPGCECDATPHPTADYCQCKPDWPYLTAMPGVTAFHDVVQSGAYQKFGATDTNAGPIHGIWLLNVRTACGRDEILARLEPAG
jgi:hypothetical protein